MSDPRILTVRPEPGEYAWTFGPVRVVAPGDSHESSETECRVPPEGAAG